MSDERDNLKRLQQEQEEGGEDKLIQKGEDPLDFTSPSQIIELPSEGKFYPESNPVKGKVEVEIESMTANEEEILNNKDLVKKGEALDRVLASILKDERVGPGHLLVGDKDALLIAARVDAYSPSYDVNIPCPICNETSEYHYNINEISHVNQGGLSAVSEEEREKYNLKKLDDHLFEMQLPRSEVRVAFRFLMGKDMRQITTKKRNMERQNIEFKEGIEQMKRYIVALNGYQKLGKIKSFVEEVMPAEDSRALRNLYEKMSPSKDLIGEFSCKNTNCNFYEEREVPIRGTFFWPDRG